MKALSPADQMFLWLEKRHQPMHVGGLMLAQLPAGVPDDHLHREAEQLRTSNIAAPPFDRQLVRRFGAWFWERDPDFDIDHHFRHLALPKPGRVRELLQLVGQLHAAPLDRGRPLWELYLIDGLEGGRFAVYTKIHHALVDGVAAMKLLQRALTEDETELDRPPPWAPRDAEKRDATGGGSREERATREQREGRDERAPRGDASTESSWTADLGALFSIAGSQLASVSKVTRALAKTVREARKDDDLAGLIAPPCILNQGITGSRRFAAQSYSLARIRAVAKVQRATVNDVVLAMCASALRRYLLDLGALPDRPLIAMVPLALRRDEGASGNHVAMILANLATHLADPAARLSTIKRSMEHAKERYAKMSPAEILAYGATLLGPAGVNFLTGAAPKVQAFNIVISNVQGPKRPLYFRGAKIEGMYPVSIVVDGQALNLTLTSYVDALEFGVIACRRTLPHVQRLLDHLSAALTELEALSGGDDLP